MPAPKKRTLCVPSQRVNRPSRSSGICCDKQTIAIALSTAKIRSNFRMQAIKHLSLQHPSMDALASGSAAPLQIVGQLTRLSIRQAFYEATQGFFRHEKLRRNCLLLPVVGFRGEL